MLSPLFPTPTLSLLSAFPCVARPHVCDPPLPFLSASPLLQVHFRVGDNLEFSDTNELVDVMVDAAGTFEGGPPSVIKMLGGGRNFFTKGTAERAGSVGGENAITLRSDAMRSMLAKKLEARYNATVSFVPELDPDADFLRMVRSPLLLTGSGSYAASAAIANRNQRRTPGMQNLLVLDSKHGWEKFTRCPMLATEPNEMPEDWCTYVPVAGSSSKITPANQISPSTCLPRTNSGQHGTRQILKIVSTPLRRRCTVKQSPRRETGVSTARSSGLLLACGPGFM